MRAHKAHVRPEGPEGAWRASHATLWGRCAGGAHDLVQEMQEIQEVQERPCGASQTVLQSGGGRRPRGPMRPIGPTALSYVARRRRAGGAGRTKGRGPATPAGAWGSAPYPSILQSANQLIPLCPLWAFVLFVVKKLAVLRVFVEMGFHKKTPGAMPSGVGLPGVLCKEPYWMEESVSFPAWRSARRAGAPAPSGSSPCPRGSW